MNSTYTNRTRNNTSNHNIIRLLFHSFFLFSNSCDCFFAAIFLCPDLTTSSNCSSCRKLLQSRSPDPAYNNGTPVLKQIQRKAYIHQPCKGSVFRSRAGSKRVTLLSPLFIIPPLDPEQRSLPLTVCTQAKTIGNA